MLSIRPIDLKSANRYVLDNHRHNGKVLVHRFSIACYDGDRLCGVAIVANPSARKLDDGRTVEVAHRRPIGFGREQQMDITIITE